MDFFLTVTDSSIGPPGAAQYANGLLGLDARGAAHCWKTRIGRGEGGKWVAARRRGRERWEVADLAGVGGAERGRRSFSGRGSPAGWVGGRDGDGARGGHLHRPLPQPRPVPARVRNERQKFYLSC